MVVADATSEMAAADDVSPTAIDDEEIFPMAMSMSTRARFPTGFQGFAAGFPVGWPKA
jgi:hypothetical protein